MPIKDNLNEEEEFKEIFIVGGVKIEKGNLTQIIINSYENVNREKPEQLWDCEDIKPIENEEEIKNCEIFINGNKIESNYDYIFKKEGNYKIKYKFKRLMTSTNFLFYGCNSLTSLDLSNFNTQNVKSMGHMFQNCYSLISLDLSNFNTENVIN